MASIWFHPYTIQQLQQIQQTTMVEHLGIKYVELGDNYLTGTMPVDERTVQSMGILHGGASVVLAETLGSVAANLVVDPSKYACVGLDINANHIRSARSGLVTGTAKPIHTGNSTQVWSIEIVGEDNRLVCISRLTMAVLKLDDASKNPFILL